MKLTIFLTLVLGFVAGCNCNAEKEFEQVCLEESKAWKAFNTFIGNEFDRNNLFESYFNIREKRFRKQRQLEGLKCPERLNEESVFVFEDDEQVHNQLCIRKRSLEAYSKVCNDGFIRKKIKKMVSSNQEFRNRLKHDADCREQTEVNISEARELSVKHKEHFYEICKIEANYDYMMRKIMLIISDFRVDWAPFNGAKAKLKSASQYRQEFCTGSIGDCCGDDTVDEARNASIIETAELLLKMAKGLVEPQNDQFKEERNAYNWDDKFRRICFVERRTALGKLYFRGAQEQTLKALHGLAHRNRTKLGRALGKFSCPVEELQPVEGATTRSKVVIGDRCEDEIKPKLMCRELTEAKFDIGKYYGESLNNLQSFWCKKEEKVQMVKDSVRKIYKAPVCSAQVVAAIKENAKIEVQILLELLELENTIERASELSKDIMNGLKNELRILRHLKKVLRIDIDDNSDADTRKQKIKAFMLISDELEKLETSEDVKKLKQSSSLASSWPNWFKL